MEGALTGDLLGVFCFLNLSFLMPAFCLACALLSVRWTGQYSLVWGLAFVFSSLPTPLTPLYQSCRLFFNIVQNAFAPSPSFWTCGRKYLPILCHYHRPLRFFQFFLHGFDPSPSPALVPTTPSIFLLLFHLLLGPVCPFHSESLIYNIQSQGPLNQYISWKLIMSAFQIQTQIQTRRQRQGHHGINGIELANISFSGCSN